MKIFKSAAKWILYLLLTATIYFFVDGLWTIYLQKEIAPEIKKHLSAADLSGKSSDTTAFYTNLSQIIAGKKILGFGEATHGTAEFEQAFSLIAKKLIREHGFNAVVFAEMNFADTWALNQYVMGEAEGKGGGVHSPYAFLQEDRLQLIEWIHDYNKTKPQHEKVWFTGADVNSPNASARNALLYCEENNLTLPSETHKALAAIVQLPLYSVAEPIRKSASLKAIQDDTRPLYKLVRHHFKEDKTFNLRQRWMVQSILNLDQALKSYYASSHREDPFRDSTMYYNIEWVFEQRPAAKLLVYAHNAHIEKKVGFRDMSPDIDRLGWHLNQKHPAEFAVIATEAWKGRYIYSAQEEETDIIERRSKIGNAIANATETPAGLLNLHATPALREFFNRGHTATVGIASPASMYSRTKDFAEAFDAIFYVRESTPVGISKLYGFNLILPLHEEQVRGKKILLTGTASYCMLSSLQLKKGVELEIAFLDKAQAITKQSSHLLNPEGTFSVLVPAPENPVSVRISFNGAKVKDFSLSEFRVNNKTVRLQEFRLEGDRYDKNLSEGKYISVNQRLDL